MGQKLLILGLVIMNLDALILLTFCLCAVSRSAAEEDDVTEMSTTTTTLTTEATTKLATTTEATTKLATTTEATTETTTEAATKLISMKTTPTASTFESFEEFNTATSKIIGVPEYITSSTVNGLNVITNEAPTASEIVVIRTSESSVSTVTNLPTNIDNVSTFVAITDSSTTSGDSITSTAAPTLHFTTMKATEENPVVSTDSPNVVSSQTDGSLMGAPTDMSTDSFMDSSESPLPTKDNEVFTSSDNLLITEGNHVLTSGNPSMSTGSSIVTSMSSTGDFMVDSMSSSTESSSDPTSSVPVISTTDYMASTSMHNLPSSSRASRNLNLDSPIYFTEPVESVDSTTEYQTTVDVMSTLDLKDSTLNFNTTDSFTTEQLKVSTSTDLYTSTEMAFEETVAVEVTTPNFSKHSTKTTVRSVFTSKMPTQDVVSTTELPMETESTSLSDTSTESTVSSVDHTIETDASTSGYVTSYELESTVAVEGIASSSNIILEEVSTTFEPVQTTFYTPIEIKTTSPIEDIDHTTNENELFPDNLAHSTFPTPSSENLTETVYTFATEQFNLTDSPLLMEVNTTNSVLLESISPGLIVAATSDATTDATTEVQSEAVTSNSTKLSKMKNSLLPITTESKVSEEVTTETSAKIASVLATTISPTLFDQRRGKKSVTATNRQTKLFKPSRSLEFVRFISDSLGSLKKRIKDVL